MRAGGAFGLLGASDVSRCLPRYRGPFVRLWFGSDRREYSSRHGLNRSSTTVTVFVFSCSRRGVAATYRSSCVSTAYRLLFHSVFVDVLRSLLIHSNAPAGGS